MIYSTKDLLKKYKNNTAISRKLKEGTLFKVSHGIYSDDETCIADMEKIFLTYKNTTLTNESAFYFYDLSDYIPTKYNIASENKGSKIAFANVEQSYMNNNLIKVGRKKVKTDYGYIYIFDKERMLVELIRLRNKFSYEYFKEVVSNYRKLVINGEIDFIKVVSYCKVFKRGDSIRKQIEDLVL